MSGISTGTGLFSGIDTGSLIEQLLSIDARPKTKMQQRSTQIQLQQTIFRSFNSTLSRMKSILSEVRTAKAFKASKAVSSDPSVIGATAANNAAVGTYTFIADRLVSTQQMLSRGFGDRDTAGLGASSFILESTQGRLDHDVALSELNGGAGVARGRIVVTDSGNRSATVDLSRTATIGEVVDAINANGTAQVTARIVDDKLVVKDNAGGSITIADASGFTTATSLGIAGTGAGKITGSTLTSLASSTLLSTLNDGNGVAIAQTSTPSDYSIRITVGAQTVDVNLGDVYTAGAGTNTKTASAVTTLGGVITRINDALTAAGVATASAAISSDGKRLQLTDSANAVISVADSGSTPTAEMLGLAGSGVVAANGSLAGRRILSGMGTTLASSLNGGAGIGGNGVIDFTARDGSLFSITINQQASLAEIAQAVDVATGGKITLEVNAKGTGLKVVDNTAGAGVLKVVGTGGDDTAAALGISTGASGVAASTYEGSNLQRQYVSVATTLASLNKGRGVGTGTFRLTDAAGASANVVVGANILTVGDLIKQINAAGLKINAAVNSQGDGIVLTDTSSPAGSVKIKVEDSSGVVARNLNLAGEATGLGASNKIDGSFERVVTFAATDTLTQMVTKINSANAGVVAAIVSDGSTAAPYRLSLTAASSGSAGRFLIDANGFDLGLTTLQTGQDARVFFGSGDPASGLLLTSSTNTIDNAVQGLKLDLAAADADPVTVTVSRDSTAVETKINDFVSAYNDLIDAISAQTSYNEDTKRAGPLLGDGTTLTLRQAMAQTIQSRPKGVVPRFLSAVEVGITVGKNGKLTFDRDKYRTALAQDPEAVEQLLFARTQINTGSDDHPIDGNNLITVTNPDRPAEFSELGVLAQMEELANRYIDSTRGILVGKDKNLTAQTDSITRQISALDARIASKRSVLQAQFLRMEKTIARLQGQQSSLTSLGG